MSPQRLAMRTLLLGRTRNVLAILLIAASLCVLDLFAGHVASVRARLEYQSVIAERLGHLAIVRKPGMFDVAEAQRVRRIAEARPGVALVLPQMRVAGIAANGARSVLFQGEGVAPHAGVDLPGKPRGPNGIAINRAQADALGVRQGSSLTLTGVALETPSVPVQAEVVDVTAGRTQPLVMPLALAQQMHDTERIERLVVFLAEPDDLEAQRAALLAAMRGAGIPAEVRTWQEQSGTWSRERDSTDLAFDSVAGMVFAVIAATIAATLSMDALERRRELAVLRALGMRSHAMFLMLLMEGLGMALAGVCASLAGSTLMAWVLNRAAQSYMAPQADGQASLLVELDFNRMLMAVVTVLAVAVLAALVPAFKAARAGIAPALAP